MVITNSTTDTVIGEVPSEWKVDILGNHYEIQQGKALSKKHREGKSPSLFLRTSNVLWGKLDLSTLDQMDFKDKEREKLRLEKGDLLICEGGDIGRTAIWNGEVSDCYYQNHVFRVRAIDDKIYSPFHMYWMDAAINLLGHYRGYGNRTTIPNLSKTRLSSFPIPLPPLPEQHAIAHVLTTVRQAIEATEGVIASVRELKRSMMKHLFTYGPVPVHEADQVTLKDTEIGEIPEDWNEVKLSTIVIFSKKPRDLNISSVDKIPFIPMDAIPIDGLFPEYYIEKSSDEITSGVYTEKGDILLAKITPSFENGKQAILLNIPSRFAYATTEIFPFHPIDQRNVDVLYIFHNLKRQGVRKQIAVKMEGTTGRQRVPKDVLRNFKIPLPDIRVQQEIVYAVNVLDEKIKMEVIRISALEALFNSLLHHLMTGKVRVGIVDAK
jgi:type I restriction enzyme, S subunit